MPLTAQQQTFVDEYLVDLSPGRAAIRAGYSSRTASQIASKLVRKPAIKAAIDEAIARRSQRTSITADRVLRELARIAFSDPRDVVNWDDRGIRVRPSIDLTDDAVSSIAEISETRVGAQVTVKVALRDRMPALKLLATHTGVGVSVPAQESPGDGSEIADDDDPPHLESIQED